MIIRSRGYLGNRNSQSESNPFLMTVSFDEEFDFVFPADGINNLRITWGDGSTTETVTTISPSHTYAIGTYQISVTGSMTSFRFGDSASSVYLDGIDSVGDNVLQATVLDSFMFGCTNATYCNLTGLDTSNVTTFYQIFRDCSSLLEISFVGLDTSSLETMEAAFSGCSAIVNIHASSIDTSKIISLRSTFYNCISLESLELSYWDMPNLETLYATFRNCYNLISLDLSSFITPKLNNLTYTFWNCESLVSLDISSLNTDLIESLYQTFRECKSLLTLDVSGIHTANVITMQYAFYGCTVLQYLNVSGWDTSNVENLRAAFGQCPALTDVYGIDQFNVESCIDFYGMLGGSTLTTETYDKVLNQNTGWASQTLQDGSLQSSNVMNFGYSKYTGSDADVVAGHAIIQDTYNWDIGDYGEAVEPVTEVMLLDTLSLDNDGVPTGLVDSIGSNNATYTGNAIKGDGIGTYLKNTSFQLQLNETSDFEFSFWANFSDTSNCGIFGQTQAAGTADRWGLFIDNSKFRLCLLDKTLESCSILTSIISLNQNNYYSFKLMGDVWNIYRDGVLLETAALPNGRNISVITNDLTILEYNGSDGTGTLSNYYSSNKIWDIEIKLGVNILAKYPTSEYIEDLSSHVVYDISGNGHHLTLGGGVSSNRSTQLENNYNQLGILNDGINQVTPILEDGTAFADGTALTDTNAILQDGYSWLNDGTTLSIPETQTLIDADIYNVFFDATGVAKAVTFDELETAISTYPDTYGGDIVSGKSIKNISLNQ